MHNLNQKSFPLHQTSTAGFTFPELLVSILIFSIIAGAIATTIMTGRNLWLTNTVQIDLQQDLRIAEYNIQQDLSQTSPSAIIDVPADGSTYNTITFRIPSGEGGDGSLTWPNETIQYLLGGTDSKQLIRQIEESSVIQESRIISSNIETLRFKRETNTENLIETSLVAKGSDAFADKTTLAYTFNVLLKN